MGSEQRAQVLSNRFEDTTLQAIAKFAFKNCGNCINRINCANKVLSSGGKKNPFGYILVEMIDNCPTETFAHTGKVSGEASKFFQTTCGKCDKLTLCAAYLAEAGGRFSVEEKQSVHAKLLKCAECDRFNDCVQHLMKEMKLTKFRLMKEAILILFRRCNKEKMQKVFIEIDNTDSDQIKIEGSLARK